MAKTKQNDDLAEVVAASLNKKFKGQKIAYVGEVEETPTDLLEFASTGCTQLDLAISNRPNGGIPFGRITELTGLEGSGKSLLAAHAMVSTQKMGGVAVLIDTEFAVNWEFFDAVGIDREKNFVYAPVDTVEDIFEVVEDIIATVRASNKNTPVMIVIDSMAGASTKMEMEATYDRAGYATGKAIILSTAMRKVTPLIAKQKIALVITNQLRHKMNAMPFADPYTTSGGKAIGFHASLRIRFSQAGPITVKSSDTKDIVGIKVKAKITKNRLGPPLRVADFEIYFDRGIDDYSSWLQFLRDSNIVTGKANALKYDSDNGEEYKFTDKEWKKLITDYPDLNKELYNKVCEQYILRYNTADLSPDDIEIGSAYEEE